MACMDNLSPQDSAVLCELLIEVGGAKIEAEDIDGHTALHFCCLFGLSEASKVLVRKLLRIALSFFIFFSFTD